MFLTVRQATHKANIKLVQASDERAETHVLRWEAAKAFPHSCLMQLMETGRYRIRDTDVAYVITEEADNFLSGLIPQRTLSAEQIREILAPVIEALEFLHEKGFVHGSVKPSSIVLINTHWKLSPDEMAPGGEQFNLLRELDTYDAPEMGNGTPTAAADMWSLGMILVEACSQRTPVWDRNASGDLGVPDWLPEPLREIARGCLRWEPEARISAADARQMLAQKPILVGAESPEEPKALAVEESVIESRPAVSTLAERVAEVRSAGNEELHAPASRIVAEHRAAVAEQRVAPEPQELMPRSRLFSNLGEDEGPSRTGPLLFAFFVLIAVAAVIGLRYRDRLMPLIQRQNTSATSTSSGQTATPPPSQAAAPAPAASTSTQPEAQTASAPPEYAGSGVSNPQNPPAQAGAESPQAAAEQPQSSAKNPPVPEAQSATPEPEPAKPQVSKREETKQTPRVMNAKGAVASRVLPNVAPGARDSMRRPVQVDVRVMVDTKGRVTSAQCVTHSRGNYWARISQQAAEGWKFKAPVSEGRPRDSYWMLLFQYNRGRTEVVARQLR